jgi:hypothetical protein
MAAKKYIQIPRGYISVSQLVLFRNDPKRYAEQYFEVDPIRDAPNRGQVYGKEVAEAMEHAKETGDLLTDAAITLIPKYDTRDQEITAEFKDKETRSWIKVLGKPDLLDSKTKAIREIKTGKGEHAWTQEKAQNHLQIKFYQMIVYLKWGVVLKEAHLDWIRTEKVNVGSYEIPVWEIQPTGHVQSFPVVLGLKDILDTMALTARTAKEIEVAWSCYVPNPKLVW